MMLKKLFRLGERCRATDQPYTRSRFNDDGNAGG
jgi:hypothetical protein